MEQTWIIVQALSVSLTVWIRYGFLATTKPPKDLINNTYNDTMQSYQIC